MNSFSKYISKEKWLIKEKAWRSEEQALRETQFTLGNGVLGIRGVLEEGPYDSHAGTYISYIYDKATSQVPELVNLPNPLSFKVVADEEKLGMIATEVIEYTRILDMKKAVLFRKTVYLNRFKKRIKYESMRFLSRADKGLGLMRAFVTALDSDIELVVQTAVDVSVTNKGFLSEGRKNHFRIDDTDRIKDISYLCVRTFDNKTPIAYAYTTEVKKEKKCFYVLKDTFKLKLKKGETVCFTKFFYIFSGNLKDNTRIKENTIKKLKSAVKVGFEKNLNRHKIAWNKLWKVADIGLVGDKEAEKALRFNIYHLLICGSEEDRDASIGARTLSGEGYRGHVFWDAEIFMLPFFIFIQPKIARNLLMYRVRRLNQAKLIAADKGYRGALFPWESADSGYDVTPTWSKDFDGRVIKITTNELEQHISADIAYAVYHYYNATGDINFLLKYGLKIIFETARFWASRVEHNKNYNTYHIRHITGPDEFHEDVEDNAYTNGMAKWNLFRASKLYHKVNKAYPDQLKQITKELDLSLREVTAWNYIASRLTLLISPKTKIIEQFKGFYKKRQVYLKKFDSNFMPVLPSSLDWQDIKKTQLVKQADVVMLLYVLSSAFNLKTKKANYQFYNPRTLHKSSLSASIHSLLASEAGNRISAYRYFLISVNTDLKNIHGNTSEGMHAASLGGAWQAAVFGFAGVRIRKGILCIDPSLPSNWKEMKFMLYFRGMQLKLNIASDKLRILAKCKNKHTKLIFKLFGRKYRLICDQARNLKYYKRRR